MSLKRMYVVCAAAMVAMVAIPTVAHAGMLSKANAHGNGAIGTAAQAGGLASVSKSEAGSGTGGERSTKYSTATVAGNDLLVNNGGNQGTQRCGDAAGWRYCFALLASQVSRYEGGGDSVGAPVVLYAEDPDGNDAYAYVLLSEARDYGSSRCAYGSILAAGGNGRNTIHVDPSEDQNGQDCFTQSGGASD